MAMCVLFSRTQTNPVSIFPNYLLFPGSLTLTLKTNSTSLSSVCPGGEQRLVSPRPTHTACLFCCFSSASRCGIRSLRYFSKTLSLPLSLLLH